MSKTFGGSGVLVWTAFLGLALLPSLALERTNAEVAENLNAMQRSE